MKPKHFFSFLFSVRLSLSKSHFCQTELVEVSLFLILLLIGCGSKGGMNDEGTASPGGTGGPGPVHTLTLRSSDYELTGNGYKEITITAYAEDQSKFAVKDNERIDFTVISDPNKELYEYLSGWGYTSGGTAQTSMTIPRVPVSSLPHIFTVQGKTANGKTGTVDIHLYPGGIGIMADPNIVVSATGTDLSESTVTAVVSDMNGNPVSGEHVTFAITSGSGRFKYYYSDERLARATSDIDGKATVTYIASGTPGPAAVKAWVDESLPVREGGVLSVREVAYTPGTAEIIGVGYASDGEAVGSMILTPEPAAVSAGGSNSISLKAEILNTAGNPVSRGTSAVFSTTLGKFANGDALYSLQTSDDSGIVTTSLIAGNIPGTAEITCYAKGVTQKVTVQIMSLGTGTEKPAATITLTADPSEIPADGLSSVSLTAEIRDSSGNPMSVGIPVQFSANLGRFPNGQQQYSVNIPNDTGTVKTSLISETVQGTAIVSCSAGGVSQAITVKFSGQGGDTSPTKILLKAEPTSAKADGQSTVRIDAVIKDGLGNPVPTDTPVRFETSLGRFSDGKIGTEVLTADNSGAVSVTLTAGTVAGTAEIFCFSGKAVEKTTVVFTAQETGDTAPANISLRAEPSTVKADGQSTANIDAAVKDRLGRPVPKDTSVVFTTTLGRFGGGKISEETVTSDASGAVNVPLTSATSGTALITCTAGSVSETVSVYFTSEVTGDRTPASITLRADPSVIFADGESSAAVDAIVKDALGRPVPSQTSVVFSTTAGRFDNGKVSYEAITDDESGTVTAKLISSKTAGSADIVCTSGNISRVITVTFSSQGTVTVAPASISLSAPDPAGIPADSSSSSAITALVKDAGGNPVPKGTRVEFSASLGTISPSIVYTPDENGKVTVSLIAGDTPGTAEVTCRAGMISQKVTVTFSGAVQPGRMTITLRPSADKIAADGKSTVLIDAVVRDDKGRLVTDPETSVVFTATAGRFDNGKVNYSAKLDETGTVTATLTSSSDPVTAWITGLVGDVSGTVSVEFVKTLPNVAPATVLLAAPVPDKIPADGSSSTVITATVKDQAGNAVPKGTAVSFETSLGRFANGQKTMSTELPGDTGVISVSLIAGTVPGTAEITCRAGSVSQKITAEISRKTGENAASFSLSLSQISVKSDNSDTSAVTATVLDASSAAVKDVTVTFKAVDQSGKAAGQISASSVVSDANGKAAVIFSSGTLEKANRVVNVVAAVSGLGEKFIPVQVSGTAVSIVSDSVVLEIGGKDKTVATVTVTDAGTTPIYDVPVSLSAEPSGILLWKPVTGQAAAQDGTLTTDVSGKVRIEVTAKNAAKEVILKAEALGTSGTVSYSVGSVNAILGIISPEEETAGLETGKELTVKVRAPTQPSVDFSTTFGHWVENGEKVYRAPVTANQATARLISSEAGLATVQVSDPADPATSDMLKVAITAPSSEAAQISLQTSSTVISISTGDLKSTATLTATVKNAKSQVVGGAAVAFSLEKTTGGGEFLSPVVAYTDATGTARTIFTSGSLSSDSKGVHITASVVGKTGVTDDVWVVIGGKAGSVLVGQGTSVQSSDDNTYYTLPLSVLVSDANGNAVSGAKVSLGAWPSRYATGYRLSDSPCPIVTEGIWLNEDENRNLILDSGEDTNKNGELTPPNTAAGALSDQIVTTDENGTAYFSLVYLKSYSNWVETEISANTLVSGTETRTTYTLWLLSLKADACALPNSPFTSKPQTYLSLSADPRTIAADGTDTSTIKATLTDANGLKVADGTTVKFATTAGTLSSSSATTTNGLAQVKLTGPNYYVYSATVTATAEDASGTVDIFFTPGKAASARVTAEPVNLTADGSGESTITAFVYDKNGNSVADNTVIVFEITQGKGALSARTASVFGGSAYVKYIAADTPGSVTVTAKTADGKELGKVSLLLIDVIVGKVTAEAGSASIAADGQSRTLIKATVTDTGNKPVKDGTVVSFSATAGSITDVKSTTSGVATAMLVSSQSVGIATVTAQAGGVSGNVSVRFTAGPVSTISLTASKDSLSADGTDSSTIRATARDARGNPVDGETLTFSIVSGGGTLSSQSVTTANGGSATVTYTAGNTSGRVTIRAKSANGTQGEFVLALSPTGTGTLTLTASPLELPADGQSKAVLTAALKDNEGNAMSGVPVTFKNLTFATQGSALPADNTWTGSGPKVTAAFHTQGGTLSFTLNHSGTSGFILWLRNQATGESRTLISASGTVKDRYVSEILGAGNWFFETDADGAWTIKVEGPVSEVPAAEGEKLGIVDTDASGIARYTYTATLIRGAVILQAEVNENLKEQAVITQVAGAASLRLYLSANPTRMMANGENASVITAKVRDENNNLVSNAVPVSFSTTLGTFQGGGITASASTQSGVATVRLISPKAGGTATVTASVTGSTQSVTVEFVGMVLSDMAATPPAVFADGAETSEIRIRLRDSSGVAIQGETISFSTTAGTLTASSALTDTEGLAKVTLIASTEPGTATVTAIYGTLDPVQITVNFKKIEGVRVGSVTLSADPPSLPADGKSSSTLTAALTGVAGVAIPDDTPVTFTVIRGGGTFESGTRTLTAYTQNSLAFAALTSSSADTSGVIRAEAGGKSAEIEVKYTQGSVTVTLSPKSVPGSGTTAVKVTALLKDVSGNPAGAGHSLTFTVNDLSFGNFMDDAGNTHTSVTAVSDASSEAHTRFIAEAQGGEVTIIGTWTPASAVPVSGQATLSIESPPAQISVVADYPKPSSVTIKGTGGQTTSQIIFEVRDAYGNPVSDGYRIDFDILNGPGGGEILSPPFALTATVKDESGTDQKGRVGTVLRSGNKSGPVSIRAAYFHDSSVNADTSLSIAAGPPVGEQFGISARYVNISGLWKFGLEDAVSVNAGDFWGNSVPDNTAVSFKTYGTGGLSDPGSSVTRNGFASSSLFSVPDPIPAQGFVSLTAEAVNGGRTTHVTSLAAVSETEHNQILYAGTNGGGMYKSLNSGATWENISRSYSVAGQNRINPYINDVAVDPDNPDTVYAATGYLGGGNVFRSLDGGLNWNSNNAEEYNGVFAADAAILTVLADDDGCNASSCGADGPCYDELENEIPCFRHVWIGTKGMGAYFASDGEHFQWGGIVTEPLAAPGNAGDGIMSRPALSATSRSEQWFVSYQCTDSDPLTGVCNSGEWSVEGLKIFGVQKNRAYTGIPYSSDNGEISFVIREKSRPFASGDSFTFEASESGLGYGRSVYDIAKVPGTHGMNAVLYAATGDGIFRSTDGGRTWRKPGSFSGGSVTTLEIYPDSKGGPDDIVYAGTADAGVWVSSDSGSSWTAHTGGMGKGLSASVPAARKNNQGMGMMSSVTVYPGCRSEIWTLTCKEARTRGGIFSVNGTVSGPQKDCDISAGAVYTLPNVLSFTVKDGTNAGGLGGFAVGDSFTFTTTRDPGRQIRDLLADQRNSLLYAVTYFLGDREPHAVGNVYVHDMDTDGTMLPGDWREANIGLPQYDPPGDPTLFAQYVLAPNIPGNPTALYIGGDGISFFKADEGLGTGTPVWQESRNGLTNLIMARMTVLFSGQCSTDVIPVTGNDGTIRYYKVYIQDKNGNPPIAGTKITAKYVYEAGPSEFVYTYPDVLIHDGTWRDPSDSLSDLPMYFSLPSDAQRIEFSFLAPCGTTVPGCSWGN